MGQAFNTFPSLQGKTPLIASSGGNDLLTVKLDGSGDVAWFFFGGVASSGLAAWELGDGTHIVAGQSESVPVPGGQQPVNAYAANTDAFVAALSSNGTFLWHTYLGGAGVENFSAVADAPGGGLYLVGQTDSALANAHGKASLHSYAGGNDGLVARYDSAGKLQWYTQLGSSGNDFLHGATTLPDGSLVVVGNAGGDIPTLGGLSPKLAYTGSDIVVFCLSPDGVLLWYTFLGGAGVQNVVTATLTRAGEIVVLGTSSASSTLAGLSPKYAHQGGTNWWVMSLKATGEPLWHAFFGSGGGDLPEVAVPGPNGGVMLGGLFATGITIAGLTPASAADGSNDGTVISLDSQGNLKWYGFYGGTGADGVRDIAWTRNGQLVLSGITDVTMSSMEGLTTRNPYAGGGDSYSIRFFPNVGL